jgi:hypothetical protein
MAYKHDVFQHTWNTVTASYPVLLNHHKEATDLVHKTIDKLRRGNICGKSLLPIINQSLKELEINHNHKAFQAFAGAYHSNVPTLVRRVRKNDQYMLSLQ